jgi:hypothetical protein
MLLTIIFLIAAALRGYGLGLYYGCRYAVRHGPQIMDRQAAAREQRAYERGALDAARHIRDRALAMEEERAA